MMAFGVAQRAHDIGLGMALGAGGSRVTELMVRSVMGLDCDRLEDSNGMNKALGRYRPMQFLTERPYHTVGRRAWRYRRARGSRN
jgi:hypothetical protein